MIEDNDELEHLEVLDQGADDFTPYEELELPRSNRVIARIKEGAKRAVDLVTLKGYRNYNKYGGHVGDRPDGGLDFSPNPALEYWKHIAFANALYLAFKTDKTVYLYGRGPRFILDPKNLEERFVGLS